MSRAGTVRESGSVGAGTHCRRLLSNSSGKLSTIQLSDCPEFRYEEEDSDRFESASEAQVTALEDIGAQANQTENRPVTQVHEPSFPRWMENDESSTCTCCSKQFWLLRRKHVVFDNYVQQ